MLLMVIVKAVMNDIGAPVLSTSRHFIKCFRGMS